MCGFLLWKMTSAEQEACRSSTTLRRRDFVRLRRAGHVRGCQNRLRLVVDFARNRDHRFH
jgi:hypothetical protein